MELSKAFFFRKVGVPEPDYLVDVELSHQIAVGPSVREVHESDVHVFQVFQKLRFFLLDQFFHFADCFVDSWLAFYEIVSHVFQYSRETPVDISFSILYFLKLTVFQSFYRDFISHLLELLSEEDEDEGSQEVVHSLHVAAFRVLHCPNVEHSGHQALHNIVSEDVHLGHRPVNIDLDLLHGILLLLAKFPTRRHFLISLLERVRSKALLSLLKILEPLLPQGSCLPVAAPRHRSGARRP